MKPSKDFSTRYDCAKKWRDGVETTIKSVLTFCANGRENDFDGVEKHTTPAEIFSTYAEEYASDLAADLVTYFTPPEERWADFEITVELQDEGMDPEQEAEILDLVNAREDKIFALIEASNYYDVAPQIFFEPASHGTAAMWVQQSHLQQPIYVESVPPHQLLIAPGHNGHMDRFREKTVRAEHLQATFEGLEVNLGSQKIRAKMEKKGESFKVCWGFWLDWSDPAVPFWRMEITVDGERVTEEAVELGPLAGACPLLVGRFNPQPERPWGRGPGMKALADIATADKVNELVLTGLDYAISPSWAYPDDGILDMSQGLQPNTAYPSAPGTAGNIQRLDIGGDIQYGWMSEERIAERIRVAFYQDGPRQRGDTPPTATQWIDEARRVQRRIGKPSAPIWSEMVKPFLQRVEYLAVQTGQIDATITHAGSKLSLNPISPLQKAQNQDKVLTTRSNLDLAFGIFGEATPNAVDVLATMENIRKSSGDELLVMRKEEKQPEQDPNATPPTPAG